MSQNWTLIGFLAETGQDQHLKFNAQSHIWFYKVFFDKNTAPHHHCHPGTVMKIMLLLV